MRRFSIFARTEKGPVRGRNQDHILVGRFIKNRGRIGLWLESDDDFLLEHGLLLTVADGVGGAPGGDIASKLALTTLESRFYQHAKPPDVYETAAIIEDAIKSSHEAIRAEAAARPEYSRMSTTLSGICLISERYIVFNAGDSRVYRQRRGFLKRLTMDDTITAQAVRMGAMTVEQAARSDFRHTITSSVGGSRLSLSVKEGPEMQDGDVLLICSDGLHDMISHEMLEQLLSSGKDAGALLNDLFNAAIGAGGYDNISAVLIRVEA